MISFGCGLTSSFTKCNTNLYKKLIYVNVNYLVFLKFIKRRSEYSLRFNTCLFYGRIGPALGSEPLTQQH